MAEKRKKDVSSSATKICAGCGLEIDKNSKKCEGCGSGLDAPGKLLIALQAGPWMVRSPKMLYRQGINGAYLVELIQKGEIQPTTAVRGPATRQLWMQAQQVPGIRALIADPKNKDLISAFKEQEPDFMGLRYPTLKSREAAIREDTPEIPDEMPVCPACGCEIDQSADNCEGCNFQFKKRTAHASLHLMLGAWYIRVAGKPWAPGMTMAALQPLIKAGIIKKKTPVRGPSTEQMWCRAGSIPQLAKLFENPEIDLPAENYNLLGLSMPTAASRKKGIVELEALRKEKSEKAKAKKKAEEQQRLKEEQERVQAAKEKAKLRHEQEENQKLIGIVKIASVALVVSIVLSVGYNVFKSDGQTIDRTGANVNPLGNDGGNEVEQNVSQEEDAERRQARINSLNIRLNQVAQNLDNLSKINDLPQGVINNLNKFGYDPLREARAYMAVENLEEAKTLITQIENQLGTLRGQCEGWEAAEASRDLALEAKEKAEAARNLAGQWGAEEIYPDEHAEAEALYMTTVTSHNELLVDAPRQEWDTLARGYRNSAEIFNTIGTEAEYARELERLMPWLNQIFANDNLAATTYAPELWASAKVSYQQALELQQENDLEAAAEAALSAETDVFEADGIISQALGYGYLCFVAGYESSQSLLSVTSGNGFPQSKQNDVSLALSRLDLDESVMDGLPTTTEPFFGHLSTVLVDQVRDALVDKSKAAQRCYQMGFHMAIVENGLRLSEVETSLRIELMQQVEYAKIIAQKDYYPDEIQKRLAAIYEALDASRTEGSISPEILETWTTVIGEMLDKQQGIEIFYGTNFSDEAEPEEMEQLQDAPRSLMPLMFDDLER